MTNIPPETWLHVAKFIPSSDLRHMLTVNSTFFQLAMSARYNEVEFTSFDTRDSLRLLWRLRDTGVAQHVRRLRVSTEFSSKFSAEYKNGYISRFWEEPPGDDWNLRTALDTIDNSLDEMIQAMIETVPYLTNVTHFLIYWRHTSPSVEYLRPFLTASWRAIGPTVQKLDLMGSMNYMPALIYTTMTTTFVELRELKVQFHSREQLEIQEEPRTTSIAPILAPFINKVAPTLRSFSLWTYTPELEVSSLLCRLEHIPHLERLCISDLWWMSHFHENTTSLSRFVPSHAATLRHFHWKGRLPSDEFRSQDGQSKEELLVDFLSGNRLDEVFSNPLKLDFPVPASAVGFRLLLRYIKQSASTLLSLRLWDHYLTYDQVEMLVSVFDPPPAGHLRKLVLRVEVLTPELVFLLARRCPCLETLNITTSHVAAVNENGQSTPDTPEEALSNARKFSRRLREYDFHDWLLKDIQISGVNKKLCGGLMRLFGECIPSVETYKRSQSETLWYIPDT